MQQAITLANVDYATMGWMPFESMEIDSFFKLYNSLFKFGKKIYSRNTPII